MLAKEKGSGESGRGRGGRRGGRGSNSSSAKGTAPDVLISLSEEQCADWQRVETYIETFSQVIAGGRGPSQRPGQPLCPRLEQPYTYGHCARGDRCPLNHPFYTYELLLQDEEATTSAHKLKYILEKLMYLSRNLPHMPPTTKYLTILCSCLQGIYTQLNFLLEKTGDEATSPENLFRKREEYYLEKCICFFAIPNIRVLFFEYCSLCLGSQSIAVKDEHSIKVQKGLMQCCCVMRFKEDEITCAVREIYSNEDVLNNFRNTINLHCQKVVESARITEDSRIKIQLQLHDIATRLWGGEGRRVHLDPFGSSQNSLGSMISDVDFCLHFSNELSTNQMVAQPTTDTEEDEPTTIIRDDGDDNNHHRNESSLVILDDVDDEEAVSGPDKINTNIFNVYSKTGSITLLSMLENSIANDVQLSQQFEITRMVHNARVPVLKMLHLESKINIDICYRNMLALENTRLLRLYSSYDPRVRPLMILVKQWTSRRKINDPTNSLPTSYAWNLIVIYFLQVHGVIPYIFLNDDEGKLTHWDKGHSGLRNLSNNCTGQLAVEFFLFFGTAGKCLFDEFCEIIRVACVKPHTFKSSGSKIARNIAYLNKMVNQQLPPSIEEQEKFCEYWKHFTNLVDTSSSPPLNRRGPIKEGKSPVAVEAGIPYRICIEDPLENHDLGRVIHNQRASALITTEFRRAISIIMRHFKDYEGDNLLQELLSPDTCVNIVLPFLCKICGGNHNNNECGMICCDRCLSTSHMRKNCDVCIICKQVGHFARDCPIKRRSKGNRSEVSGK